MYLIKIKERSCATLSEVARSLGNAFAAIHINSDQFERMPSAEIHDAEPYVCQAKKNAFSRNFRGKRGVNTYERKVFFL